MNFAEELQREKARLGLTLASLAALLDVAPRSLHHWIKGDRLPLAIAQEGALARLSKAKPQA